MSVYDILMALGLVVMAGVVVKGFLSSYRVEPMDQPDNHQKYLGGPHNPQ